MRFHACALAIALLVTTSTLHAQGESHVDSFSVNGRTITIVATNTELVRLRVDSSSEKGLTATARAVLLDIWIPGARNAIARGVASDSLRDAASRCCGSAHGEAYRQPSSGCVIRTELSSPDAPASELMLELNDRIEEISQGHGSVRTLLTAAL